jgi:hypothetical protein
MERWVGQGIGLVKITFQEGALKRGFAPLFNIFPLSFPRRGGLRG